jgi:hypothetical protein
MGRRLRQSSDLSRTFLLDSPTLAQPLRMLVVDESRHVRQMCCEVAEAFGFVGIEAETTQHSDTLMRKSKRIV